MCKQALTNLHVFSPTAGEGNVFTGVCVSTGGLPSGQTPQKEHGTRQEMTSYTSRYLHQVAVTAAVGTHPTGMHSCYFHNFTSASVLSQVAIDQVEMPRPASNGSGFQPKGAVFKVHSPKARLDMSRVDDSRPSSVKSDTGKAT